MGLHRRVIVRVAALRPVVAVAGLTAVVLLVGCSETGTVGGPGQQAGSTTSTPSAMTAGGSTVTFRRRLSGPTRTPPR